MSQDLFDNPDDPVEFSGVSGSGESNTSSPFNSQPDPATAQAAQPIVYNCPTCNKVLKTLTGFVRHKAAHLVSDANARRPGVDQFTLQVFDVMEKVVAEILAEPVFSNPDNENKAEFLEELGSKIESVEWMCFVAAVSDPILESLCKKTKVLPINQYEDAQCQLNYLLNDDEKFEDLKKMLSNVCETKISAVLVGRLVFRFCQKLLDQIQSFVVRGMRVPAETGQRDQELIISEEEKRAFTKTVGEILRNFAVRCTESRPIQFQVISCLKDKFVFAPPHVSTEHFTNKSCWMSGTEDSVIPSDLTFNFFFSVEKVFRNLCSATKLALVDEVLVALLDEIEALNCWHSLTSNYFSEEDSLIFMKDIVNSFLSVSSRQEEKRRNRQEDRSIRETQAALRTHLQRNYRE